MSQTQEGEQQEEKKKEPFNKVFWRWLHWFTSCSASLLSFFIIWLNVDEYYHDWYQTFLFILLGCAFYSVLCFWPGRARWVGIVGMLPWSVAAWSSGYTSATETIKNTTHIVSFGYQFELIYTASIPFALLFFAFILLLNRDLVGK